MIKNNSTLTIAAVALVVVLVGVYFFVLKESTFAPSATPTVVTVIESSKDLDKADSELSDDSDFDSVDSSFAQLDTELSNL